MAAVTDFYGTSTDVEPASTETVGAINPRVGFGPSPINFEANAIAQILNAVLITLLNTWVLLAIFLNRHRLWDPLTLMIANLAFCDLLMGLFAEPTSAYNALRGISNAVFCGLKLTVSNGLSRVSMLGFGLLSLERYLAVRYPYRHQAWFTTRNATLMWVSIWLSMMTYSLGLIVSGMQARWKGRCLFQLIADTEVLVYFTFPVIYVTQALAVAMIYAYLFFVVRRQLKDIAKVQVHEDQARSGSSAKREMKVAFRCASMLVLQLICQWPLPIKDVLHVCCGVQASIELTYGLLWMKRINSALNPLCFAYTHGGVWRAMRGLLPCKRLQQRVGTESENTGVSSTNTSASRNMEGPAPIEG